MPDQQRKPRKPAPPRSAGLFETMDAALGHGLGAGKAPLLPYVQALAAERRAVLLSIKPQFAQGILSGAKRVEFRRKFGPGYEGWLLAIYASSPVQAVVALTRILAVTRARPAALLARFAAEAGAPRELIAAYLGDRQEATALTLAPAAALPALSLAVLRTQVRRFRPPMNYSALHAEHPVLAALLDHLTGQ